MLAGYSIQGSILALALPNCQEITPDGETGQHTGWHGWVYGWKLHLVTTVAGLWLPLAAELTPANTADNEVAPLLLAVLPTEVRFVPDDHQYDAPNVRAACGQADRNLVTFRKGGYPHTDDGVEVRRVFHQLRSVAIENFNEQFKASFDAHGSAPRAASSPPGASPSARSSSTNSCSGTVMSTASTSASDSNRASRSPEDL